GEAGRDLAGPFAVVAGQDTAAAERVLRHFDPETPRGKRVDPALQELGIDRGGRRDYADRVAGFQSSGLDSALIHLWESSLPRAGARSSTARYVLDGNFVGRAAVRDARCCGRRL